MSRYSTKLSSKNQITLPVDLIKRMGWNSGQKFSLIIENNDLLVRRCEDILEDISDIVKKYDLPETSVEEAIEKTRNNFNKQKFNSKND